MNRVYNEHKENINNFYTAVEDTRNEGTGVSIKEIAEVFREKFDEPELKSLIKELSK